MGIAAKNATDLWRSSLPNPAPDGHKYDRGHTAILGADAFTGATRLAAEACSRIGSGLVSVVSDTQAQIYRTTLPADIMVTESGLDALSRVTTLLAGPGGCSGAQAQMILQANPKLTAVLDADAIRLWPEFEDRDLVLTPHEGEFSRYFRDVKGAPTERASSAAKQSGAVIVLKGPNTVIASPDGRIVVNETGSRYLAKAGSGDVLAGFIAGLIAQGMSGLSAACAAVWIHGVASERIGPGLLPQDLFAMVRPILRELLI